jgi:hypothetical protein
MLRMIFQTAPNQLRLHNKKRFDLNRQEGSLERHHELETIVHIKVLHSPIVNAGYEDHSVTTWSFLFQHEIYHIDKIVDNGLAAWDFPLTNIWMVACKTFCGHLWFSSRILEKWSLKNEEDWTC